MLIASPALTDPNFHRSVVLIAEHTSEGAMGLVLNRPLAIPVAEAVPSLAEFVPPDDPVREGGPVQPQSVLALADFVDVALAPAVAFASVGFLPSDVDQTVDPGAVRQTRVFAGYAGWGAGQLEDELEQLAWFAVAARPEDCFADGTEDLWRSALRRHGGQVAMLALLPDDPSRN